MINICILTIADVVKTVVAMYHSRGFVILSFAVDNQFEPLSEDPEFMDLKVALNITS